MVENHMPLPFPELRRSGTKTFVSAPGHVYGVYDKIHEIQKSLLFWLPPTGGFGVKQERSDFLEVPP